MANKYTKKDYDNDIFDAKIFFKKYAIRILIIMAIAFVPIFLVNYFLRNELSNWLMILIDVVLLGLASFIGLLIYSAVDSKKAQKPKAKEKERDPFAD